MLAWAPVVGAGLIAVPALASSAHKQLHTDHGFVIAVAPSDAFLKVKTPDHGDLTLASHGKSLRQAIDAVSVTDYVEVTYESAHKGKLVLKTLHDTSVAASGKVTAVASDHKLIAVRTAAHGSVKLHVLKLSLVAHVKVGESVDIDYYKAADDQFVLVNIGRKAPIGATGPGSGTGKGGSAGSSSSGSSGSSGSGSFGSAGSGSAGSSGGSASAGSGGSSSSAA